MRYFIVFVSSFFVSFLSYRLIIPRFKETGIVGKNMHSENKEEIPEMGGLMLVAGFSAGIIMAIALHTFFDYFESVHLVSLLSVMSAIFIILMIGIFDDLISMPQYIKAIMPVLAALPIIVIKQGSPYMEIPFLGKIDFGLFYILFFIPVEITIGANAVNMLAGFNGLEVGLGIVIITTLSIIALLHGKMVVLILLTAALGSLIAALKYNWYPAKILVGDVGTLSIGAIIAVAVILGNLEIAGLCLLIPFIIDFFIKAKHHFPYTFGEYKNGKLYCPSDGPKGLAQVILKLTGGLKESNLTLLLMGIEAMFGVIAILFYL